MAASATTVRKQALWAWDSSRWLAADGGWRTQAKAHSAAKRRWQRTWFCHAWSGPPAGPRAAGITVVIVVTVIATLRPTGVAEVGCTWKRSQAYWRAVLCGVRPRTPLPSGRAAEGRQVAYPNVIRSFVLPAPARRFNASPPVPRRQSSSACPPPARPASAQNPTLRASARMRP